MIIQTGAIIINNRLRCLWGKWPAGERSMDGVCIYINTYVYNRFTGRTLLPIVYSRLYPLGHRNQFWHCDISFSRGDAFDDRRHGFAKCNTALAIINPTTKTTLKCLPLILFSLSDRFRVCKTRVLTLS